MSGAAPPAVAAPRVLVWRHGRTSWNAEGRFQGQLDPPLDEVGRAQAARAAAQLAALLPPEGTAANGRPSAPPSAEPPSSHAFEVPR